jgi:hypothetical protein
VASRSSVASGDAPVVSYELRRLRRGRTDRLGQMMSRLDAVTSRWRSSYPRRARASQPRVPCYSSSRGGYDASLTVLWRANTLLWLRRNRVMASERRGHAA